jgi:hypothetical protein
MWVVLEHAVCMEVCQKEIRFGKKKDQHYCPTVCYTLLNTLLCTLYVTYNDIWHWYYVFSELKQNVDIVVATPGRLIDLLNDGHIALHGT